MKKELERYTATAYWWNFGSKKKDYSGTLYGLLVDKSITVKKVKDKKRPELDCYVFKTRQGITYKYFGHVFDGAFVALKLFYAYMGDKATVNVQGRTFTINH